MILRSILSKLLLSSPLASLGTLHEPSIDEMPIILLYDSSIIAQVLPGLMNRPSHLVLFQHEYALLLYLQSKLIKCLFLLSKAYSTVPRS